MKKILAALIVLLFYQLTHAQEKRIDSLLDKIDQTADLQKAYPMLGQLLATPHGGDALLKKGKQDLAKAQRSGELRQQLRALSLIGFVTSVKLDVSGMLSCALQGIRVSRELHDDRSLGQMLQLAAAAYYAQQDKRKAAGYFRLAVQASITARDTLNVIGECANLEPIYAQLNMPDSALFFGKREMVLANKVGPNYRLGAIMSAASDFGEAMAVSGHPDSALFYYYQAYHIVNKTDKPLTFAYTENNMAKVYLGLGKRDSALKYALDSYNLALTGKMWEFQVESASTLAKLYEGADDKKSLFYLKAQMTANDSANATDKSRQFQLVADKDKQYDQDLQTEHEKYNAQLRFYAVIAAGLVVLIIGIILWRNNKKQKHTNLLLSEQKEEIETQRDNLGQALEELKNTQTQLVQREKMASLGELTAGIAHEIQNPLNFVNNFSDVNQEMLDELDQELDKGDIGEAKAIAADIRQNESKINHHGKRADAIVKGMLQHSRTSSGQKELTDLNALADEYLRLAYHGLRAKDKDFNAELITNFDDKLPKINIIPQDIGRVMLNVINNAFYATQQKAKTAETDYKPTVEVNTAQQNGSVIISVKDNGTGIPESIREKIMQPFFTTKPTGEGTGLGLSLSYDIVVKGHGGSIDVDTIEGEGSEFMVTLPL